jgi:hypothetical protein
LRLVCSRAGYQAGRFVRPTGRPAPISFWAGSETMLLGGGLSPDFAAYRSRCKRTKQREEQCPPIGELFCV